MILRRSVAQFEIVNGEKFKVKLSGKGTIPKRLPLYICKAFKDTGKMLPFQDRKHASCM